MGVHMGAALTHASRAAIRLHEVTSGQGLCTPSFSQHTPEYMHACIGAFTTCTHADRHSAMPDSTPSCLAPPPPPLTTPQLSCLDCTGSSSSTSCPAASPTSAKVLSPLLGTNTRLGYCVTSW